MFCCKKVVIYWMFYIQDITEITDEKSSKKYYLTFLDDDCANIIGFYFK